MPPSSAQIEKILAAAVELPTPEARQEYLAQACAGDFELQRQVEQMLEFHFQAGSFLESPAQRLPETTSMPMETVGQKIGHFKLLEKLGEGGMGTVWVAEREKPIRQRVALKLIKPGMDSASVLHRFDAERQALALMSHNNIAKMLDAGTSDTGRPYFVMELVKGVPITKYCDETHASIEERLRLFIPVCQAVQHAHQKGIIHRDIKPSNVLVCIEDGKPVPKVIDFGIAKALHQPLTDGTLHTGFNQVVGTLEYMSPEQAELNALDIDTRADIYALGILLFELLTGSTPVTRAELRQVALVGMLRQLKEVEPRKPSTRLSESKNTIASLAAMRRTDPAKLMREVRGDLDWIVLKCLEADRTRRYETTNALVRDVERHLANEPVEARAPSTVYRLKKFAWRNLGKVTAACVIFLCLSGGVIGTSWGMMQANAQRELAEKSEIAERDAKEEAVKAKEIALKRLNQIEKSNEILASIFDHLNPYSESNPYSDSNDGKSLQVLLLERLDIASELLNVDSVGDPITFAILQVTFGKAMWGFGQTEKAVKILDKANQTFHRLAPDHVMRLNCMNTLGNCFIDLHRFQDAVNVHEETLAFQKAKLGMDHAETLATTLSLANSYIQVGRVHEAINLCVKLLDKLIVKYGLKHRRTLQCKDALARGYWEQGRTQEAVMLLEENYALSKANFGQERLETLVSMNNLAVKYQNLGRHEEALPLLQEVASIQKTKLGLSHIETFGCMRNLAFSYWFTGQLDKSIPLFEEILKQQSIKMGRDSLDALWTMGNLGANYLAARRTKEAIAILEEAWEKAQKHRPFPKQLLSLPGQVGRAYLQIGQFAKAEPLLRENLARLNAQQPLQAGLLARAKSNLGQTLFSLKNYEEAEVLLRQGYEGLKQHEAQVAVPIKRQIPDILLNLVVLYEANNKPDEAAKWRAELAQYKTKLKESANKQVKTTPKAATPAPKK